jgi:hypothetical protein
VPDASAAVARVEEAAPHAAPPEPAAAPTPDEPSETEEEAPAVHGHGHSKSKQFAVLVKTEPEGSRVTTGRHLFGTTPLTLKLRPGNSYDLTFTRAGYATLSRRYHFEANAPQTLRVALKKLPEAKKVAATPAPKPAPPPPPPPPKGFFSR